MNWGGRWGELSVAPFDVVIPATSHTDNRTEIERVLVRVLLACRAVSGVQLALSVGHWIPLSAHPAADAALLALVCATALASCWLVFRAGTPRRPVIVALDVLVGVVVLASLSSMLDASQATSWADWAYPITLFTAASAGLCFRPRAAATASLLLMAAYLTELQHVGRQLDASTVLANAAAYPLFLLAAYSLARLLRRLGTLADEGIEARETLAALEAGEVIREQLRPLVHAYDNVVTGVTDERMPDDVRRAYLRDADRLRSRARAFLTGGVSEPGSLAEELRSRMDTQAVPPIIAVIDAVPEGLSAASAQALLDALDEAVLNARKHSDAHLITITSTVKAETWTVEIRDDGSGFLWDEVRRGHGHGLHLLTGSGLLARHGMSASVRSSPGMGTTVRVSGSA